MLASILPGLRDLRTPLASGYLWLVAAWVLFAQNVPDEKHAHGVLAEAYKLGGALGTTAVLAAATFAAYLVGSIAYVSPAFVMKRLLPAAGIKTRWKPDAETYEMVILKWWQSGFRMRIHAQAAGDLSAYCRQISEPIAGGSPASMRIVWNARPHGAEGEKFAPEF